jgi:hypothetical protein
MKLTGWHRIGIIASVVWILAAYFYTFSSELNARTNAIAEQHVLCDEHTADRPASEAEIIINNCNKTAHRNLVLGIRDARVGAVMIALGPVPLGWGLAYLVLFLTRWVRRGFENTKNPTA